MHAGIAQKGGNKITRLLSYASQHVDPENENLYLYLRVLSTYDHLVTKEVPTYCRQLPR